MPALKVHGLSRVLGADPTRFGRVMLEQRPGLQLLHLSLTPSQGVPVHSHPEFDVVFQTLSGAITVKLNGRRLAAGEQTLAPYNDGKAAAAALITLAARGRAP